jgi:hypothetical protein
MTDIVGADPVKDLNESTKDQFASETTYKLKFKLRVNGNLVLQHNSPVALLLDCDGSATTHQINELVLRALISAFNLDKDNIKSMIFSLFGMPVLILTQYLQKPGDIVPMTCIPICDLHTLDYPEKKLDRLKCKFINWGPLFMTRNPDGTFDLHQKF